MMDLFEKLRGQILSLPNVEERPHERFGKNTYYVDDHEFLHFHGRYQIDVLIPKQFHSQWLGDPRIKINEYAPTRLECDIKKEEDIEFAMKLIKAAYDQIVSVASIT